MYDDAFLQKKLDERIAQQALRKLTIPGLEVDFCSNDYLGIVKNGLIEKYISGKKYKAKHGATGSRLLSGNYELIENAEKTIANFHLCEAGTLFNSGYDANIGLLSCIAQKADSIIYDKLSHASIRDGIRLSFANAFSFAHNDLDELEKKLRIATGNIFVVTESVFSMDGDFCPLIELVDLCDRYKAHLIVDEAHALGVVGKSGEGLVQHLNLQEKCFARIYTYGKAAGCHGAFVAGSARLKEYLVNFARSFIYSTSMPEVAVEAIIASYQLFPEMNDQRMQLMELVKKFLEAELKYEKLISTTSIQGIIVPGNDTVRKVAKMLQEHGFDVRPILYPTVPEGRERLRIVLHSYNTFSQIEQLIKLLS